MTGFRISALAAAFLLATTAAANVAAQDRETSKPEGAQELFERAYYLENGLKKLDDAIALYRRVAALAGADRELEARALLRIAACEHQRGKDMEALEIAKQVLAKFADLPEVKREAETSINEAGAARRILRLYDVAMIITGAKTPARPSLALPDPQRAKAGGVSAGAVLSFDGGADVAPGTAVSPERLVELIKQNIAADTWESERARIDVEGSRLIIVQTPEVHAQIEAYLEQLRLLRGRVITIEATLALVDRDVARSLAPGATLTDAQAQDLERRLNAGDGAFLVARPRATVFNRQPAVLAAVRAQPFVGHYEVNQTGVTPVVDPKVETLLSGLVFTVVPTLVEGGDDLLLGVRIEGSTLDAQRTKAIEHHGDVDLPAVRRVELESSVLAASRTTVVAAVASTPYGPTWRQFKPREKSDAGEFIPGDWRLALILRPSVAALGTPTPAVAKSTAKRPLRTYNVSLLTESLESEDEWTFVRQRGAASAGGAATADWGSPLSEEALVRLITENISPDSWSNTLNRIDVVAAGAGELVVVQTPDVHAQIEAYLASLRSDRGTLLGVELYEFALEDAAWAGVLAGMKDAGPEANTLPPSVLEDLAAGRVKGADLRRFAAGAIVNGQRFRLGVGRTQRLVRGIERASGGTGTLVSEVTAPIVGGLTDGYEANARAKLVPGGRLVMADVSLDVVRLESTSEAATKYGAIDLPVTVVESPSARLTFPVDRVLVVGIGEGLAGLEERTLTLLRVRPLDVLGKR
jgi:hypothetical protein